MHACIAKLDSLPSQVKSSQVEGTSGLVGLYRSRCEVRGVKVGLVGDGKVKPEGMVNRGLSADRSIFSSGLRGRN